MIPEERPTRMDHMPIITTLDTTPGRQEETPKHNFKATDWLKFREELTKKLNSLDAHDEFHNENEFHTRLKALTLAIMDTVKSTIPKCHPSPYTKRWWSKELSQK